jgi:hypothetical protein
VKPPLALSLAAIPLLLAGCAGASSGVQDAHVMPDGTTMSGSMSDMNMTGKSDPRLLRKDTGRGAPTGTATMICGHEIRDAVARNLQRATVPKGMHVWADQLFSCSYRLPGGDLRLSVKDLDRPGPGRAYFERLRARLPGATTIKGLADFGFPAFETADGNVVFIKDHKTLRVDATRLADTDLPAGISREDAAYGVAAAVIACWTE